MSLVAIEMTTLQVYRGLFWQTAVGLYELPTRGVVGVCLCSPDQVEAEIRAYRALRACPGILPVLGRVDFAASQRDGGRAPAVPHLQGYCTTWPVSNLETYLHRASMSNRDEELKSDRVHWYRPLHCDVRKFVSTAQSLLCTLLAVHRRGLVHQGLSMRNIFMLKVDEDRTEPCLGDLSFCVTRGSPTSWEKHASLAHTAPEVALRHTQLADSPQMALAAGVLLWEMCTGLPPASIMHPAGYHAAVALAPSDEFVGPALRAPGVDDRIDHVLRGLMNVDPEARMTLDVAASVIQSLQADVLSPSYATALQV
jgi:hypothetical protein